MVGGETLLITLTREMEHIYRPIKASPGEIQSVFTLIPYALIVRNKYIHRFSYCLFCETLNF